MSAGADPKLNLAIAAEHMLDRAAGGSVLCVGDLMLDRFVVGRVERISPEAPIPVLAVDRETVMPGGVGNVVSNIRALGGNAHVIAVVGEDSEAQFLQGLLGPASDLSFVRDRRSRPALLPVGSSCYAPTSNMGGRSRPRSRNRSSTRSKSICTALPFSCCRTMARAC